MQRRTTETETSTSTQTTTETTTTTTTTTVETTATALPDDGPGLLHGRSAAPAGRFGRKWRRRVESGSGSLFLAGRRSRQADGAHRLQERLLDVLPVLTIL